MEQAPCPICASEQRRVALYARDLFYHASDEIFTYARCLDCGHLYLNPRPAQEEMGRVYPPEYGAYVEPAVESAGPAKREGLAFRIGRRFDSVLQRIATRRDNLDAWLRDRVRARPGMRLLDVGCGRGVFLKRAFEWGYRADGVEPSRDAVTRARADGLCVSEGSIDCVQAGDGTYDIIRLHHVLEHVHDPRLVLGTIRRLLADNGSCVITVPCADDILRLLFGRYWFPLQPPYHLHVFSFRTVSRLASELGFEVEKKQWSWSPCALAPSLFFFLHYGLRADANTIPARHIERLLGHRAATVFGLLPTILLASLRRSSIMTISLRKVRSP